MISARSRKERNVRGVSKCREDRVRFQPLCLDSSTTGASGCTRAGRHRSAPVGTGRNRSSSRFTVRILASSREDVPNQMGSLDETAAPFVLSSNILVLNTTSCARNGKGRERACAPPRPSTMTGCSPIAVAGRTKRNDICFSGKPTRKQGVSHAVRTMLT